MSSKTQSGYNPKHSLLSLFPFEHLMAHHLTDAGRNEAMLVIQGIEPQEVETEPSIFEEKPVLKFKKTELGYVLTNRHDLQTLTDVYGIHSIGDATGKTITIALMDDGHGDGEERLMIVPPSTKKPALSKTEGAAPKSTPAVTDPAADTTDDSDAADAEPPVAQGEPEPAAA